MRLPILTTLSFVLLAVVLGAMTSEWEKPKFYHGLDGPSFKVIEKTEDYELRSYGAGMWASTVENGYGYDKAVSKGFMKLFRYISGENDGKHKIAMTVPVKVLVKPGEGPFCENNFKISFFVPHKFQESPPEPNNKDVFLEDAESMEVYVTSYAGWNSEAKFMQHAAELTEKLHGKGLAVKESYYTAGYDSPFRLFNRHNEVWLVKDNTEVQHRSPTPKSNTEVHKEAEDELTVSS